MPEPDYTVDRRVFQTTMLGAPADDKLYWLSRTPEERLETIQFLREINYGKEEARGSIQRVITFRYLSDE